MPMPSRDFPRHDVTEHNPEHPGHLTGQTFDFNPPDPLMIMSPPGEKQDPRLGPTGDTTKAHTKIPGFAPASYPITSNVFTRPA